MLDETCHDPTRLKPDQNGTLSLTWAPMLTHIYVAGFITETSSTRYEHRPKKPVTIPPSTLSYHKYKKQAISPFTAEVQGNAISRPSRDMYEKYGSNGTGNYTTNAPQLRRPEENVLTCCINRNLVSIYLPLPIHINVLHMIIPIRDIMAILKVSQTDNIRKYFGHRL